MNNLTLRVLSVYDDHLDGTEITLSLSTAGLATVRSGDTLPPLAARSFGTEVVRDYDERQKQLGVQIHAKASESCVCVISLRPKIVVDGLRWDLGPRGSAELPAGMSVPLTVGEAWEKSLELRVIDANGSTFAMPRGLPSSLRLSASRLFAFAAPGAHEAPIDPPRVETRGSRGKAPNRAVGKVGIYDLTVHSGDAAGAPLESTPIKVELKVGEVDGIVVESELTAIQDRCKLPPNAIGVLLQDEGGNPIPPQRACRYVLNVTSDDLSGGATMSWDDGQGRFVFESELVVVRNRSQVLSLKFAVRDVRETRRGGAVTLPSLTKQIGTGWAPSSRIARIGGNETGLVLSPGSPPPPTSFKLVTADGSALEASGIIDSYIYSM